MDGLYPPTDCRKTFYRPGPPGTFSGVNAVTGHFILNKGQAIYDTLLGGYPNYVTDNPPAVTLFIRVMPSLQEPGKMVLWINGYEKPRLHLIRGKKYALNVACCGYPIILSTDPIGGNGDKGNLTGIKPFDYGATTISISPEIPNKFYYQCSTFKNMGNQIIID